MEDFKIAAIVTSYQEMSHADVIVSRWLEPHARDHEQGWHPKSRIVSLYVDQNPTDGAPYSGMTGRAEPYDHSRHIGRSLAQHYDLPIFPSIRDALTLGGETMAVDAVLLIGEHGDYPVNELGQKLYPRHDLFQEIARVMDETGRAVPLFNDKHYSWSSASAHAMVAEAQRLKMPLFAGSSIAFAGVESDWPQDIQDIREAVLVFYDDLEAYGYHSFELAQTLLDHRAGHQTGVAAITVYKGNEVWAAADSGVWSQAIQEELFKRSHPGMWQNIRALIPNVTAFHIEYRDGVRVTHIHLPGERCGFHIGARLGSGETFYRRARTNLSGTFFSHFACLNREVEKFFVTGTPPFPPERVLLTTCLLAECMAATKTPATRIPTPDLAITYRTGNA